MTNTTNTKNGIGQSAKPKAIPFVAELDMRDYFAAKAMQGIFRDESQAWNDNAKKYAEYAYKMADAMLKERAK